jgi:hypothetical protein
MNLITYTYTNPKYGFLDLFDNEQITPHTWITTAPICSLLNNTAIDALEGTNYNFTLQQLHDYLRPLSPRTIGDPVQSNIPSSSTMLLLINNPADAAAIFETAKHCRQHIAYYRQLFGLPHLQPTDDVALSIASHLLSLSTGFVDFPAAVIHVSTRPVVGTLSVGQQSVCNLTGVNYVSIR